MKTSQNIRRALLTFFAAFVTILFCSCAADSELLQKKSKLVESLRKARADAADAKNHLSAGIRKMSPSEVAAATIEVKLMDDRVRYWEREIERIDGKIHDSIGSQTIMDVADSAVGTMKLDAAGAAARNAAPHVTTPGFAPAISTPAVTHPD